MGKVYIQSRFIFNQIHVGLIILMVFITMTCAPSAKGADNKKKKSASSSAAQRYIKEPYESKDYMLMLGEQLGSKNRDVLLYGINQSDKSYTQARVQAPPQRSSGELQKLEVPVFEDVPNAAIVRPEIALPTQENTKPSLVFPRETEQQNPIVSPDIIQPDADKPSDSGEREAPAFELTPVRPIGKPDQTLAVPGEYFDSNKSSSLRGHQPTYSEQHFKEAANHAGYVVDDVIGVFTAGLGSKRAAPLRENDGKSFGSYLAKTGNEGGKTINNVINVFYSLGDVILLDSLPNPENETYKDNHALLRPFIFSGKAIITGWKTIESTGNTLTFGYFDNVTGSAGMCAVDIAGFFIHGCQGILGAGKGPVEPTESNNESGNEFLK
jgi:hypothetical protein